MMRLRLATPSLVVLLATVLGGCGSKSESLPGLLLNEPTAVAAFRGFTTKTAALHTYFAVANASGNNLTIIDAADDSLVPAPVPLRPLVFPVPDRPALLASASLNDGEDKADLLVVVAAGDSRLQVVSTWDPAGAVTGAVELGADVLALVALPSPAGTARIAAALSGKQLAIATFTWANGGAGPGIAASGAPVTLGPFDFQPVALAAMPGDGTHVYAATADAIVLVPETKGVAQIRLSDGAVAALDAGAPTRLVAAARLAERIVPIDPLTATTLTIAAFAGQPTVERVYAILDESGCGQNASIACGLVALDPLSGGIPLDPAGELAFRAPIAIPGAALALAAAQPPAFAPSDAPDPSYAGTYVRMVTGEATRWTTATAAVASTDGALYFLDLGRWEMPGEQAVAPTATLVAKPDPEASTTGAMSVTRGYTPTVRWTATYQGEVPGLAQRRAESGDAGGGAAWLALQAAGGTSEVVQLYDPALGIHPGDVVVISDPDPTPASTSCAPSFEAMVSTTVAESFIAPDPARPGGPLHRGGALLLDKVRDRAGVVLHPEWNACVDDLATGKTGLRATVRAGEWILTRPLGTGVVQVGRPVDATPFAVQWENEAVLSCPASPVLSCDPTCRDTCQKLLRARLARRIDYTPALGDPTGPALAFTLQLKPGLTRPPTRGFAVIVDTNEGRGPFHASANVTAVDARAVVPFDRSPIDPASGVRFLVPYASGVVLDATPTVHGGGPVSLH